MARRRTAEAAQTGEPETIGGAVDQVLDHAQAPAGGDVFDQQAALREQERQVADSTQAAAREPGDDSEAEQPRKKWTPPANPRGWDNHKGEGNRVRLLRSDPEQRNENGAWVIRFETNPNETEGYSRENPHPVLKMLKEEGFRWGFDRDGKGGWGKEWGNDPFGTDHMEARKVLQKAAEMIGAQVEQSGPDR